MSSDETNEERFIRKVDCRFPYGDLEQGFALAREACSIGPNCAFMVMYELARPGRGARAREADRLAVLDHLASLFQHPLARRMVELTRRLIQGERGSVAEGVDAIRAVAPYPHQYNALALACSWPNKWDEVLDVECERIEASWQ